MGGKANGKNRMLSTILGCGKKRAQLILDKPHIIGKEAVPMI